MKMRASPTMDETYALNIWTILKNEIQKILNVNSSGISFEELYRNAYKMTWQHGDILYDGLRDVLKEHLDTVRDYILKARNNNLLQKLNEVWNKYESSIFMIKCILIRFDRVYVMQNNLKSVYSLGLHLFRDYVLKYIRISVCHNYLSDLNRYNDQLSSTYNINGLGFELSRDGVLVYYNNPMFLSEELPKIIKNNCALIFVNECVFLNPNRMFIELNNGFHSFYEPYIKQQNSRRLKSTYRRQEYKTAMATLKEGLNNEISNVNEQIKLLSNGPTENPFAYDQLLLNFMSFIVNIGNGEREVTKKITSIVYLKPNSGEIVHNVLKKMFNVKSDEENNQVLEIVLENYMRKNGLFKLLFKEHLMKRLLSNNIVSFEDEKKNIDKLQITFGKQLNLKEVFTNQLQPFITKTKDHFIREDSEMNSDPQIIRL